MICYQIEILYHELYIYITIYLKKLLLIYIVNN